MSSFNDPAILMPLDEYYDHYVQPKPHIPRHYTINSNNKQRKSSHLQSYKDEDEEDEQQEENQVFAEFDEVNSTIEESAQSQINFETEDFNQNYNGDETLGENDNKTSQIYFPDIPVDSVQWRIQPINVNRPPGAAPLVPTNAVRNPSRQPIKRNGRGNQRNRTNRGRFNHGGKKKNWSSNNNNNARKNSHVSVHRRLGNYPRHGTNFMAQPGRIANNGFDSSSNEAFVTNNNNYNNVNSQQVLMDVKDHFQNGRSHINTSTQLNPTVSPNFNHFNESSDLINNQLLRNQSQKHLYQNMNSIPSIMDSVKRSVVSRLGHFTQPTSNEIQPIKIFNHNLNALKHHPNELTLVSNGQMNESSSSLRLGDLLNMDISNCQNLNVADVAKNAMLLLSAVYHKPVLNEDVQQVLTDMQGRNNISQEPRGVNMSINPETTQLRMNDRFK